MRLPWGTEEIMIIFLKYSTSFRRSIFRKPDLSRNVIVPFAKIGFEGIEGFDSLAEIGFEEVQDLRGLQKNKSPRPSRMGRGSDGARRLIVGNYFLMYKDTARLTEARPNSSGRSAGWGTITISAASSAAFAPLKVSVSHSKNRSMVCTSKPE